MWTLRSVAAFNVMSLARHCDTVCNAIVYLVLLLSIQVHETTIKCGDYELLRCGAVHFGDKYQRLGAICYLCSQGSI